MNDPFLFQRSNAAELFIVRHADAIPEADEIIPSGVYDNLPLSRIGREQAQVLAERLSSIKFDALYTSPLQRCQETLAPLAKRLEMTPTIVEELKEIRLGSLDSLPADSNILAALTAALKERQIELVRKAGGTGSWDAVEGSEPSKEFRRRVVESLDDIANRHIGQRVVVMAHGGVVNAYAAETLGLEKDFFFPAANTSITVVRVAGQHRVLYILNDVGHLQQLRNS